MTYKLIHGDCFDEMANFKSGSFDLILTDPPYGTMKGCAIDFWDSKEQRGQGCIYTYKDLSEERLAKMLCELVEGLGYKKVGWEQLSLF